MKIKTLIIDNFDSFTYNLYQYVAELGGNPVVVRNNAITTAEIARGSASGKFTHIIISPGPGSPDKKKDFGICGDVIKKFKGVIPILGVCLGHQGIIYHLGGRVIRAPEPVHGKRSEIKIDTSDVLFKGLPKIIEGMRYHSLIGEERTLPGELIITATTKHDGLIMAVSHKNSLDGRPVSLFGIQFHPESIGTNFGKKILKNFLNIA